MRNPPEDARRTEVPSVCFQVDVLAAIQTLSYQVERGLRDIDFDEVTIADRVTYVECIVEKAVESAIAAGRFDVAVGLRYFAARRVADLAAVHPGSESDRSATEPRGSA